MLLNKIYNAINRLLRKFQTYFGAAKYVLLLWLPSNKLSIKIDCDDLFILTSCTNPYDEPSNVYHNKSHSCETRLAEIIKTIESVRKYFPQAVIVCLENSTLKANHLDDIKSRVNYFLDYSKDQFIRATRKNKNKGVPWIAKLFKFSKENNLVQAKRIHFLVGRYELFYPVSVDPVASDQPNIFFKYFTEHNNVSTRYFYMENIRLADLVNCFRKTYVKASFGSSVEDVIFKVLGRIPSVLIDRIGVNGMVNGKDFIDE
jgi:hypothetical protein